LKRRGTNKRSLGALADFMVNRFLEQQGGLSTGLKDVKEKLGELLRKS